MAGVYIHIPFCKAKCRYCDFTSYPGKIGFAEAYMACVLQEIKLRAAALQGKVFDTVYFGGGTPSVIDAKWIAGCMRRIRECLLLQDGAEVTIELNPGTVTADKIAAYKAAGVNRFSVGLQTAVDSQLSDLGRVHNAADFSECCRLLGKANFNADVMIGLKDQTFADVEKTVRLAHGAGASHISLYALTPEDGTPMYTDYLNGELPDGDEVASVYERARVLLESLGYARYEVSNFAKPGFESRHNCNYWRRGEYIGFGVSASSFMNGRRFTNTRDLDEYMKCILSNRFPVVDDEAIGPEDAKFETVMLALRTSEGLDEAAYKRDFGSEFYDDFKAAIQKNIRFLERSERGRIRIKGEYLYVQNHILVDFLR